MEIGTNLPLFIPTYPLQSMTNNLQKGVREMSMNALHTFKGTHIWANYIPSNFICEIQSL